MNVAEALIDGIFDTGAYKSLSKSQNPTLWVKVVHLEPNVQTLAEHAACEHWVLDELA